ncbi:hypothetical protein GJ744_002516 [Endocarpon pusillum]|uniref:Uncharacterized protein n=1 Tax=Endocarpon pusillum TaxID=364733 RepID=A0A8H7A813_9EURO|nr:hypothetical protein GJ744_002516 [Endocarpon pusillum]
MPSINGSPTLSASPSPSLDTPDLSPSMSVSTNRSFSNVSSLSSNSSRSSARSFSLPSAISSTSSRRRGYIRPQGVTFAPSAQNRESVLSLGSIAHLQYYFARTGLLDGKGGQLAKTRQNGEYDLPIPSKFSLSRSGSDAGSAIMDSPIEDEGALLWDAAQEDGEEVMLPPTVSTYAHRTNYVPPPPDQKSLKKDLVDALENALHALEDVASSPKNGENGEPQGQDLQGFYEIQGLHLLDTTTLAIRAARLYYTLHPNPTVLHSIKPDFQIRRDLISVLDVLKKWAARKFAGGLCEEERLAILVWVSEVGMMIDEEVRMEEAERQEREGWQWMDNSLWSGREKEREIGFLETLLKAPPSQPTADELPPWEEVDAEAKEPTAFLTALLDGRKLVQMHNAAVRRSKRHFGEIKTWHDDVAKPYRRAENMRFWMKAAEIRWDIKVVVNVMSIVNTSKEVGIWKQLEDAVLKWSKGVREEIIRDWMDDEDRKLHARARSLALASPAGSPQKSKPGRETLGDGTSRRSDWM